MNVLVDYHHGNLFGSMHLLAERMGWNLFRPIGMDWFINGYFKVAEPYGNAQDTLDQYLAIDDRPYDSYKSLNGGHEIINDVYHIYDTENKITHKAITFETFKKMEFDLIIATHPLHELWEDLLQYQPKAKFLVQLGNENQQTMIKNVLCSVWGTQPQSHQNFCYYHQEYPMEGMEWSEPQNLNKITSFVHLLPHPEIYEVYKNALPEFEFKSYGSGCRDGMPKSKEEMIRIIKESTFGWHIKPADGYGHLIHQWYACGRPVITKGSYYEGKTGGMLLTDQETCIDLDKHSIEENIELIRYWSIPENNRIMCQNALKRFHDVVNYDEEAKRIKTFLSNIL